MSDAVKKLLSEKSQEKDDISEELVLAIYDIESDLAILDRRHGIKEEIQRELENFVDQDED